MDSNSELKEVLNIGDGLVLASGVMIGRGWALLGD